MMSKLLSFRESYPNSSLKNIYNYDEYSNNPLLEEISNKFKKIWRKKKDFLNIINDQMIISLNFPPGRQRPMKMINSFATPLDALIVNGEFIALDVGGTNYRIYYLKFENREIIKQIDNKYMFPNYIFHSTVENLFEFLAECVRLFMIENCLDTLKEYNVGWTFSFPTRQVRIDKAFLLKWTKKFKIKNMHEVELVEKLSSKLKEKGLNMQIRAVINDTIGTLFSCLVDEPNTVIGLIVGTGTNACYIEKKENIKFHQGCPLKEKYYVINTEWGALGDNQCFEDFLTEYDRILDEESLHPGNQIFEKLCAASYIGEVVRLVILDLVKRGYLFKGKLPGYLAQKHVIKGKFMSDLELPEPICYDKLVSYSRKHFGFEVVGMEAKLIRYVSRHITARSAHCVALALASLIMRIDKNDIVVGVDGSLFREHNFYMDFVSIVLEKILSPNYKCRLVLQSDGSGKGAAAAAASVINKNVINSKLGVDSQYSNIKPIIEINMQNKLECTKAKFNPSRNIPCIHSNALTR